MRLLCLLPRSLGGGHLWSTDDDDHPMCLRCKRKLY